MKETLLNILFEDEANIFFKDRFIFCILALQTPYRFVFSFSALSQGFDEVVFSAHHFLIPLIPQFVKTCSWNNNLITALTGSFGPSASTYLLGFHSVPDPVFCTGIQ